jgi:hypothetical protein
MREYRDDIVKKTLAATFNYGFRHVDDSEGSDPKTVEEEIKRNLECYATTSLNDAFMHIWQSYHMVRYSPSYISKSTLNFVSQGQGKQNRILAPYMNPNILETAQSHYYIDKNAIAERMEHLGNKFPLMREEYPELFVWNKELPLTALVLILTKVRNIVRHLLRYN